MSNRKTKFKPFFTQAKRSKVREKKRYQMNGSNHWIWVESSQRDHTYNYLRSCWICYPFQRIEFGLARIQSEPHSLTGVATDMLQQVWPITLLSWFDEHCCIIIVLDKRILLPSSCQCLDKHCRIIIEFWQALFHFYHDHCPNCFNKHCSSLQYSNKCHCPFTSLTLSSPLKHCIQSAPTLICTLVRTA